MKIYTKKGDYGETSLFGGGPLSKDHVRVEAYGSVDELNSVLGCAVTALGDVTLIGEILEIQKQLFVLGSELAALQPPLELSRGFLQNIHVEQLEHRMDEWERELKPLKQFILPGGHPAAAFLHLARTVCRRAERHVVTLNHQEKIRPQVLQYLNRLSDWLFVFSRWVNRQHGLEDVLWEGLLK